MSGYSLTFPLSVQRRRVWGQEKRRLVRFGRSLSWRAKLPLLQPSYQTKDKREQPVPEISVIHDPDNLMFSTCSLGSSSQPDPLSTASPLLPQSWSFHPHLPCCFLKPQADWKHLTDFKRHSVSNVNSKKSQKSVHQEQICQQVSVDDVVILGWMERFLC